MNPASEIIISCINAACPWVDYDESAEGASLKAVDHFIYWHREMPALFNDYRESAS